jgi:hypothetical protein
LKCNATDVSARAAVVDRRSGKKVRWYVNLLIGGSLSLCGAFSVVGAIAAAINPVDGGNPWWQLLMGSAIILAPGVLLLVRYIKADKVRQFEFRCERCGHTWEEREVGGESESRCVACGEHAVTTETIAMDPESGKKLSRALHEGLGWFLVVSGVAGGLFSLGALLVWRAAAWLLYLGWSVLFVVWGRQYLRKYYTNRLEVHTCAACDHAWQEAIR